MVSSTLGRGGAERQVLTCLNQLDKSKRFASINLLCRFKALEEVEATYYEEINRLNVEIDQYQNENDWDSKFGISEIPENSKMLCPYYLNNGGFHSNIILRLSQKT